MVSNGKRISVLHDDQLGKAFVAMAYGMRKCLVCDGLFTTQGAAEHADRVCYPQERDLR